ncbi:MAG: hypothetical protein M1816_000120 [Peltula sp. TS41687]|nr:MAG: hypothetical protein M1816_000120 [Peltula sp. TS41687]
MSGRWDPERFHREREHYERSGGHVLEERDVVDKGRGRYYEEHDRFHEDSPRPRRGGHLDLDDRYDGRSRASPIPSEPPRSRASPIPSERGGMGRGPMDADRFPPPRGRFEEEKVKVVYEDNRPSRDRREPIYFEDFDRLDSPSRSALVPTRSGGGQRTRRQSIHIERDYVSPPPPSRALPSRPKYIRRQSSLDTFDRRPLPRYGDQEDYRPPVTVPVPLPRRRRSPVRRFEEREYEEIRVPESDYYVEDQRDVREVSTREYRFKSSDFEPEEPQETTRRGKTRMPRRLVEKSAIDMLGYPFEEEMDHIVILRALGKEQIDEVVRVSKDLRSGRSTYVHEETKLIEAPPPQQIETFGRHEIIMPPPEPAPVEIVRQVIHEEFAPAPPPPPPMFMQGPPSHMSPPPPHMSPPPMHMPPPPMSMPPRPMSMPPPPMSMPPPPMTVIAAPAPPTIISEHFSRHEHKESRSDRSERHKGRSKSKRRSKSRRAASVSSSTSEETIIARRIEKREESDPVHGPLTMFMSSSRKDERDIKSEMKALELEEKALKLEHQRDAELRKAERVRERGERHSSRSERHSSRSEQLDLGDIKVERNKKGKMSLVRS